MNNYDNDIDSFLNLPQDDYTPISTSPNTQTPQLASQSSHFANNTQTFAGPSFQYDAYRQQTGLPVGALANTFAVNQTAGLQHYDGQGSFVMPSESFHLPLSKVEDFDFNNMADIDYENDSPADASNSFFASASSQFVAPTTLMSNTSPSASTPIQRIYPGMHSQAAAKAQQAAKQQELARQQQQQSQQQARPAPAGQKPLPKGQPSKDPRVEESISRILNQMRQKSVSGSDDADAAVPSISNMPRAKKDEEDMDEDERLLASEEGKKLSSKERRQLRNKVSARAFRSRRKEYIGQLEGELAGKVDEANTLRTENQQLREENNRLTDLTRMLLSSQAFSGFLQELSQSGLPPQTQQRPQQTPQQERPQPQRKDVNPHEAARQMQSRQPSTVGMALVPESNVDLSLFDTPSWNSGIPSSDFQVFAVTEIPEGPVLELSQSIVKDEKPSSETVPTRSQPAIAPAATGLGLKETHRPMTPCVPQLKTVSAATTPATLPLLNPKSKSASALTPPASTDSVGSWESLDAMCTEMEDISQRLETFLPASR